MIYSSCLAMALLQESHKQGSEIGVKLYTEGTIRQRVVDYRDIDKAIKLANSSYDNAYTKARERERKEIESLINKGCKIDFYNGFITINGKTFNGWGIDNIKSVEFKEGEIKIELN